MKIKSWLILPVAVAALSMPVTHAQDEFDDEIDFESEEADVPSPVPPSTTSKKSEAKKQTAKAKSSSGEDEDFSDADFGDADGISFEDFDAPSDSPLVSEGFDDSAPGAADGEFELEPLTGEEPPVVNTLPPDEPMPPIETPADTPSPIISEPSEEYPQAVPVAIKRFDDSGPDLGLEAELHDIYLNFHSKAIPRDQWNLVVGDRRSEVYSIESGDNLWNVSRTLFNDGNYWPKIWAINKRIENPHVVEPGDQLRFVLGSEEEPPSFTLTEDSYSSDSQPIPYTPVSVIPAGSTTEVELPPPLVEPRPVLRRPPPSLPEVNLVGDAYDEVGIQIERRPKMVINSDIYLTSYVDEENADVLGKVVEIEGTESKTATDFQYIYVSLKAGVAQPGQNLIVAQTKNKIRPSGKNIVERSILKSFGEEIEVQGAIRLESHVPSRKIEEGYEMFRAIVEKSISNVRAGAQVRAGSLQMIKVDAEGPRSQVVSQIVGGIFDGDRKIFGDQNLVFLNRGAQDGLEPGQVLSVRANESSRKENSKVGDVFRTIGILKIVKVTPKLATAVIVRAFEDIQTGDLTGEGALLSNTDSLVPTTGDDDDFGSETAVEMIPTDEEGEDFEDPLEDESSFE